MEPESGMPTADTASADVELVEALPAIRSVAMKLIHKYGLRGEIELDDLVQVGAIGFVEAARRWQPMGARSRRNYALSKVGYVLLDHLREISPNKRAARVKAREVNRLAWHQTVMFGRKPSSREMASILGMEIGEYYRAMRDLSVAGLTDPEYFRRGEAGSGAFGNSEAEDRARDGLFSADADRLRGAISRLPAKERIVIELSYFSSMGLDEIGERLGHKKSYISKLRKRGIEHLSELMRVRERRVRWAKSLSPGRYCRPSLERKRPDHSFPLDSNR